MESLIGTDPEEVLVHGPKKTLLSTYIWHSPEVGIVASYTPTEADVEDHFDLFRGVDQIESFAQATIVSCGAYSETVKIGCTFAELKRRFIPVFLGVGQVKFHNYVALGDVFISIGHIKFYKFRQMTCDGRIYKVPKGLDINAYFRHYDEKQLLSYELSNDFTLVAELFDVTGRAIKRSN